MMTGGAESGRAAGGQGTARPVTDHACLPLEAKLRPPVRRAHWVQRRGLLRHLAASRAAVVLIDAPAGYGKTVLAAQWHASAWESRPVAWVSLDPGDNDPARLWRHAVQAVQRASPARNLAGAVAALGAATPDITGEVLPVFVNELARLPTAVLLLLDGYESITESACHEQVGFLIGHARQSLQLAMTTRSEPALPLGRLRAAGDITEIAAAELRLAPDEAGAVAWATAHVRLRAGELTELLDRTEGWPAGVYLAALSLRDDPSPGAFIDKLTGRNRYIADFLTEQVLARQPDPVRQFLERTAILPAFTAPLCDAVTGAGNAAGIIERAERDGLFVVRMDDERLWFRYQHLFREVLLGRLMRSEPGLVATLHARASAWHERSGTLDEAIGHTLAAGDDARAVNLIATHWGGYAGAGKVAAVAGWLRSVGDDRIAASAVAAHCAAWVAALSGSRRQARRWLAVMDAGQHPGPLPDGAISLEFSAALLRGTFGFDGLRVARESAAKAAGLAGDPASGWYAVARSAYGWDLYLSGDHGRARAVLREALLADAHVLLARILALAAMSLAAVEAGRLVQADAMAQAAVELAAAGVRGESPYAAPAYLAIGAVHAGQGLLADARREFGQALRTLARWGGSGQWVVVETQLRLAQVLLDLGNSTGAGELLGEVGGTLRALPDGTQALRARLARLERRLPAAPRIPPVTQPLSERERAILRLMRGTLSRREIGKQLGLSVNTIKTHMRMIYRKLGVSTREAAVERAVDLGII
jgi:LuxR family maltose regulon positive regulatory protein